ncbi:hypothetical protein HDV00_010022 [Rhizophlyctis rosea]|nr:hypothetical protein HDV00_010022 [Rhizophlyctis rosea]
MIRKLFVLFVILAIWAIQAEAAKTAKVVKAVKIKVVNEGSKCGSKNNGAICAQDLCCSTTGYCGKTYNHCAVGKCQPKFGHCGIKHLQISDDYYQNNHKIPKAYYHHYHKECDQVPEIHYYYKEKCPVEYSKKSLTVVPNGPLEANSTDTLCEVFIMGNREMKERIVQNNCTWTQNRGTQVACQCSTTGADPVEKDLSISVYWSVAELPPCTIPSPIPEPTPAGLPLGESPSQLGQCLVPQVNGATINNCGANASCSSTWPMCICNAGTRAPKLSDNRHVHTYLSGTQGSNTTVWVAPHVDCDTECSDSECSEVPRDQCDTQRFFPGYALAAAASGQSAFPPAVLGLVWGGWVGGKIRFGDVRVGDEVEVVGKDGKVFLDEVVYVFRPLVKDAVFQILEYVTEEAKDITRHSYIHHATHGPVLITSTTQRLIKNAGAYTAVTRTQDALLIVDGIIASPWAVRHELMTGPIARGFYTILKPSNLHVAVLNSDWIRAINDVIGPAIMRAVDAYPVLVVAAIKT